MDPLAAICRKTVLFSLPFTELVLLELLFLFVWIFFAWKILKPRKRRSTKIIGGIGFGIAALPIIFLIFIGFILKFESWGEPPSQRFAVLNAAVKNTCYLDPQRNNCPKNVDQLIAIEPEHFQKIAQDAQITYQYYPETNQYTLIVRDKSLSLINTEVALFDPRLSNLSQNYSAFIQNDIAEPEFMGCFGKNIIVNPPPFPGPWDNI